MVPLAVRSHYSLMWGTASIPNLCRSAKELGYKSLALTDRDNLYGLWPFLTYCRREGIRPIVGAEITSPHGSERAICLVKNSEGYKNLCRLMTQRHRVDDFDLFRDVELFGKDLLILTESSRLLTNWKEAGLDVAAALSRRPDKEAFQARQTAQKLGIPAVAIPDASFINQNDRDVHRTLRAIGLNTDLSRLSPEDVAPEDACLASPDEYARRFAMWPEAISATMELAERIDFTGPDNSVVMPPWRDSNGKSASDVLRNLAYDGARYLYGDDLPEPVVERLEHELALIEKKRFSSYFLVVRDIILRSPRICGRGSGAASLVAYCLRITNVCPIKHNLYFERFINADRKDPPDIDVDFAWDERDEVINSVLEQYRGRSAMVSSHVLIQPRMAIRETAKVFGLAEREIGEVSRRLPWFWKGGEFRTDLKTKLFSRPETRDLEFPDPWPQILDIAQKIVGAPRHLSVHPGGVIITPGPIEEYVPIETAPKGVPIIQWEKDAAEDAGLVKIDLLGNRSLAVIRDAIGNVRDNGDSFVEKDWEPEDDLPTRDRVAKGLTMGCFYIESPATRLLQKKAGVGDFEHLVIHSSIIRPAANEFIREYIRRLKGGVWEPIHPLLDDILDETFGIMVYQEDVSRTAVAMAGFSHAEADGLRKVMSKKDKETALRDYHRRFVDGARIKGVSDERISAVWNMMLSFSGYSFCKPHSASYARVSFQSAYLKEHHPAEFMAAVISNQGGFYGTFAYVSEARRLGLTVLLPDVNESLVRWRGSGQNLRTGLMAVKSLGKETQNRIVAERERGRYSGFGDFWSRVRPDEDECRSLIHAGALDSLHSGEGRTALLWRLARRHKSEHDKNLGPQAANLFGSNDDVPAPVIPQGREIDTLRRQYTVLGFLPDRHPFELFKEVLSRKNLVKAAELPHRTGCRVRVAGWLLVGKLVKTKHGDPMQFLTFEDETAIYETTFFPKAYDRFCSMLDWGRPYILSGLVKEEFGAVTLTVDRVEKVAA